MLLVVIKQKEKNPTGIEIGEFPWYLNAGVVKLFLAKNNYKN